jgi:hypothetical protein
MTVINPLTTQVRKNNPGDWTWRLMSAATMNTPEPIIDPITRVVASKRPRPFTRPDECTVDELLVAAVGDVFIK